MGCISLKENTRQLIWREKGLKYISNYFYFLLQKLSTSGMRFVTYVLIQQFILKRNKLEAKAQKCLSVGGQENRNSETPLFWIRVIKVCSKLMILLMEKYK